MIEKLLGGELVINFALQGHKPICNGGLWSHLLWFWGAGTTIGERPDGAKVMTATGPLCERSNVFKEGHGKYLPDNHILFKPCLEMRLLGGGPVGKGLYNQRTL